MAKTVAVTLAYIGDGYLAAAEYGMQSEDYFLGLESEDGFELEYVDLPRGLADLIVKQGTSEQFYSDGYEAAYAVAPFLPESSEEEDSDDDFEGGTVISGTMRREDLIPAFIDELQSRIDDMSLSSPMVGNEAERKKAYSRHTDLMAAIERRMDKRGYFESDDADYDLEALFDALEEFAPEGYYFGSHPGDASDYGYWAEEDE